MRRIPLQDPHIKQSFFFILWPRGKVDEPEAREGGKSLRLWIGEDFDERNNGWQQEGKIIETRFGAFKTQA
jgi:hypothetical protein